MKTTRFFSAALALIALAACQKTEDPFMTLETKELTVEAGGGSVDVVLSSNVYYRVNNDCTTENGYWAEIKETSKNGSETTFTVTCTANESTSERKGEIRFIGDNVTPLKLTITQKGFVPKGIDPVAASGSHETTSATFKIFGDAAWTASCQNEGVTIEPSEGLGEAEVTVTFPANDQFKANEIKVNVEITGDKTYEYVFTQSKYLGILADWDLKALKDETTKTFVDSEDQSVFPGTNGKYLKASTGTGKIEYWASERTGYTKDKVSCTRAVGTKGGGDPYVSGAIPEDYWLVTASHKNQVIPAGTKIHFYFVTKFGTGCSAYWNVEYKAGENWVPALATSKKTETAKETIGKVKIDYSAEITYNFAGLLLDSKKNGAYLAVEGTFTTETDMNELQFRFKQAGHLGLDGSKNNGLYIDKTSEGGQTRFSAQRPSTEDGKQDESKIYDQHVTFEFVE